MLSKRKLMYFHKQLEKIQYLLRKPYHHFFCLTHTILWAVVKRCCNRTYVSLSLHIVYICIPLLSVFCFCLKREECWRWVLFVKFCLFFVSVCKNHNLLPLQFLLYFSSEKIMCFKVNCMKFQIPIRHSKILQSL